MKLNESKQKVALVQGESFRCTAFQDDDGTWRGDLQRQGAAACA